MLTISREEKTVAGVAFELNGTVLDPHELLQYEDRWLHDRGEMKPLLDRLFDFVQQWTGKKGGVWFVAPPDYPAITEDMQYFVGRVPWKPDQLFANQTLLMLARRVPRAMFRIPDARNAGFRPDNSLHDATLAAVRAQAAYRALTENAGTRANEFIRSLPE